MNDEEKKLFVYKEIFGDKIKDYLYLALLKGDYENDKDQKNKDQDDKDQNNKDQKNKIEDDFKFLLETKFG